MGKEVRKYDGMIEKVSFRQRVGLPCTWTSELGREDEPRKCGMGGGGGGGGRGGCFGELDTEAVTIPRKKSQRLKGKEKKKRFTHLDLCFFCNCLSFFILFLFFANCTWTVCVCVFVCVCKGWYQLVGLLHGCYALEIFATSSFRLPRLKKKSS